MENYLSQQRIHVFSNVGVLIYVFDIESRDVERDMATYIAIIAALMQYSPSAKVFVLIHKMDLILGNAREAMFDERVRLVRHKTNEYVAGAGIVLPGHHHPRGDGSSSSTSNNNEVDITAFATSIWDQSLYKAWASIIHDLVPNLSLIETNLAQLGRLIESEEILLFERTSFLVVSSWSSREGARNPFEDRYERMSNIMKSFKSSLSKYTGTPRNAEQFRLFELKAGLLFSLFISKFTTNTYILVCLPPGEARFNSALLNTKIAAQQFEFLDSPPGLKEAGAKDLGLSSLSLAGAAGEASSSSLGPGVAVGPSSQA